MSKPLNARLRETYGRTLTWRDSAVWVAGDYGRTTWGGVEAVSSPKTRRQLVQDGLLEQHPDYSGVCRLTGRGRQRLREVAAYLEGRPREEV